MEKSDDQKPCRYVFHRIVQGVDHALAQSIAAICKLTAALHRAAHGVAAARVGKPRHSHLDSVVKKFGAT
jgi:hypothetical protein